MCGWRDGEMTRGRFCDAMRGRSTQKMQSQLYWRPCALGYTGTEVAYRSGMERSERDQLEARTLQFAIDIVLLCEAAGRQRHLWSTCNQLTASAGSVAANHRAMGRARSTREFAAKLHTVHEEADESVMWLQVIKATNRSALVAERLPDVLAEAERLRNLFGKSRATTRDRYPSERR